MTNVLGVAEAVLYVEDLPAAVAFYSEVLGLPQSAAFPDASFHQAGPAATLILFDLHKLQNRDSPIPDHGAHGRGHVALAIPTEQMDDWRRRLLDHGVEIEHEQVWQSGSQSIYFRDLDQNSLELIDDRHYAAIWKSLGNT